MQSNLSLTEQLESGIKLAFSVKFYGDGTNITRNTGLCVMSFSLFCTNIHEVSQEGHDSYELYKSSFADIWSAINLLHDRGTAVGDGISYELHVYLAGHYKFLLMVYGMSGATSKFSCIYCTVHSKDRWDMSKPENFYDDSCPRTIDSLTKCSTNGEFSCKHKRLVNLPLETYFLVDEVHLMLRVTGRVFDNLILDAMDLDAKDKLNAVPKLIEIQKFTLNIL